MKVYITRHGETEWNALHKVCGATDIHLTENGRQQAREAAEGFDAAVEKIYVSPLIRARETASYFEAKTGLTAIVDERIKEFDFGEYEGTPWEAEDFREMKMNPFARFPKGESILDVAHRSYSLLDEIVKEKKDVLIVCHGTLARIMCTYFRNFTIEEYRNTRIKNCQILEFEI